MRSERSGGRGRERWGRLWSHLHPSNRPAFVSSPVVAWHRLQKPLAFNYAGIILLIAICCSTTVATSEPRSTHPAGDGQTPGNAAGSFCSISRRICRLVDYLPCYRLFPSVLPRSMTKTKQPFEHGTMAWVWTIHGWAKRRHAFIPLMRPVLRACAGYATPPLFYLRARIQESGDGQDHNYGHGYYI